MKKFKILSLLLSILLIVSVFTACETGIIGSEDTAPTISNTETNITDIPSDTSNDVTSLYATLYNGSPYIAINDNIPLFTSEEKQTTEAFEKYSELDNLGRCGIAYANVCKELMPTEKRESLSSVTPSGWKNKQYDFVDGGWLYNRAHIIGFQLAGEQANELNLITGTRYFNVNGMLPFENMVADYVKEENGHVLYRVTPVYDGDNLVAEGVIMEGWSVEDEGEAICFNVFVFNVQPGVTIDYATGESWLDNETPSTSNEENTGIYILNTNSKKFHETNCSSVDSISEKNKDTYKGDREMLIKQGYTPCGSCKP